MQLKAVNDFILLKDNLEKEETEGGLVLTAKATGEMRYQRAQVVAVGNLVKAVVVSDKIHYDSANSFTMIVMGVPQTVIRESMVVLIEEVD